LTFWTQDADQIARLVGQRGLNREKWDRQDYRDLTISKALATRRTAWTPFPKTTGPVTRTIKIGGFGGGEEGEKGAKKGVEEAASVPKIPAYRVPFPKTTTPVHVTQKTVKVGR
jgi:hypothetical protein